MLGSNHSMQSTRRQSSSFLSSLTSKDVTSLPSQFFALKSHKIKNYSNGSLKMSQSALKRIGSAIRCWIGSLTKWTRCCSFCTRNSSGPASITATWCVRWQRHSETYRWRTCQSPSSVVSCCTLDSSRKQRNYSRWSKTFQWIPTIGPKSCYHTSGLVEHFKNCMTTTIQPLPSRWWCSTPGSFRPTSTKSNHMVTSRNRTSTCNT